MEITKICALRGPNLWTRHTAIEATVACTENERSLTAMPQVEARLRARFPEIGFLEPATHAEAMSLAHVLELATLGLQAQAGCPITFSRTAPTHTPGVFQVAVEYTEEAVGRLALELAEALCRAAVADAPFDINAALARLHELDEDLRLGPSTGAIVQAATVRGVPYCRLTSGSLVQFGWGSRQRRIQAAETDRSSAIAESVAQDKELTKKLLAAAGVPVPTGRSVVDAEDAWRAACEIGGPVVVKPRDGNQGKGVAVGVEGRAAVMAAYEVAAAVRDDVIVERSLSGNDFRLLVVGRSLVAAARRDPPQVIGDGVYSVRELVEQVNRDPRRSEGHATSLTKICFDDTALARLALQGYTADSVPPRGQRIILRNNANLSTGGTATDVTDEVHPEVAARAVAAAQMVGLDICGVDVVCDNVRRPLEAQGGGIVEVNAAPGLRMHLHPSFGKGRAVGEKIVSHMFAEGEDGRIPVVAVTGTNGKTTTVRLIAHIFASCGLRVGMTNSDGVFIAGRRIDGGDCSGPRSAHRVLMHPDVDAAVLETARGGILREGLAFDRCQVAVVTNLGAGDHLGLNHVQTLEELAAVKEVVVHNVSPHGAAVLNAADPLVAAMAETCPGSVTFFAHDPHHPVMAAHRTRGRPVVYVEDDVIVAAMRARQQRIRLADIPLTRNGTVPFQVENAMAAIAAAWAAGVEWDAIRAGLASFVSDPKTVPGRFNVFDHRGAAVIADYGHNSDAMRALVGAVEAMPARRRLVVISGAGDRRDADLREQTEILGDAFDEVILYQDQCQRGRSDGEVLALLRQGLGNAKRAGVIEEIRGEFPAIDTALTRLDAGDLCLILVDQVEAALAHIEKRIAGR